MERETSSHGEIARSCRRVHEGAVPMLNMQTDLLRTFATVADLRSFTRAGEVLGRTQPAISLQIKRLEELVRAPLFERESTPLRLTPTGEQLATYARQILFLHDEAVARLFRPHLTGAIHVGLPNDFAVTLLPEVLGEFAAANADIRLEVACDISANLLRGLQEGRHDLIVAMTAEQAAPTAAKLWADRLAWVVPPARGIEAVRPLPLIAYPEGCVYRTRMTDALSRAGIPWDISCTTASLSGLKAAVQAGLGLTVLSVNTMPTGFAILPPEAGFPGLADVTVGLYYARERLSDVGQSLINFMIRRLDSLHPSPQPLA